VNVKSSSIEAPGGAADAAGTPSAGAPVPLLLDFDPAFQALAIGQQQPILVRATSPAGFPGGTLTVHFNPSIAAAVAVKPILGSETGMADTRIEGDRVVLQIPASPDLTGTRAVAEITVRGIAPGQAVLTFEPSDLEGASVTYSQTTLEVR
jgi:hypothetical protein